MQVSIELSGKSSSTLTNYARCLAHLAMHYDYSPELLDSEQIESYLYKIKIEHKTPSERFFKHTVYGLSYVYKILGMKDKHISLPSLEFPKKLPVVMSKEEVKQMLKSPKLLKHRLILGMLYGCGLRRFELLQVELKDLDFDRKMLHIVQGKGRKDRYVSLPDMLIRGLKTYIEAEKPEKWLFNGRPDKEGKPTPYSPNGIQWVVYAKRPFGGPKQVIEYLGRYTHKIAISNHRIKSISNNSVSFTYKDYRQKAKKKTMSLTQKEFIRRFSLHILPNPHYS